MEQIDIDLILAVLWRYGNIINSKFRLEKEENNYHLYFETDSGARIYYMKNVSHKISNISNDGIKYYFDFREDV